jgi:hypothetical protein
MSTISNRHSVVPFVAGKTAPLTDQRLAKVGYKTTKKQKAKYGNVAVSVPILGNEQITQYANDELFIEHVRGMLETAQDGIIRSLYESNDGILQSVSDEEICVSACLAFLESEKQGGRLTKVQVEEWFDENVKDNLYVMIAEKLGFNDPSEAQDKVIVQHTNAYRGILASLSGGKTMLNPQQIAGCRKAIELASSDDEIAKKLVSRLDNMEKPVKLEELLEL